MIKVVAAVICRGDEILICRRPEGKNLAGFYEFPGGKVEKGETERQALVRECMEELNLTLSVGEKITAVKHDYGGYLVEITFFNCAICAGQLIPLEHSDVRWVKRSELKNYSFCPADNSLISLLTK